MFLRRSKAEVAELGGVEGIAAKLRTSVHNGLDRTDIANGFSARKNQ